MMVVVFLPSLVYKSRCQTLISSSFQGWVEQVLNFDLMKRPVSGPSGGRFNPVQCKYKDIRK